MAISNKSTGFESNLGNTAHSDRHDMTQDNSVGENLISHRRHQWKEGRLNANDGTVGYSEILRRYHIHSNLFEIDPATLYTIKAWSEACRGYFVFFDENTRYISAIAPTYTDLQTGYAFTSPVSARYIALDSYIPEGAGYAITSLSVLGQKHLYKLEKGSVATSFSIALCDIQDPVPIAPSEKPRNDTKAARQMVACAESYIGKGWVYGQEPSKQDTLTSEGPPAEALFNNDVKQIDCMTLMVLAINGIPYFQSKYFNNSFPWRNVRYYQWGKYPDHLWMENFALWCYSNGWEILPGINYNNLRAGDLVFWGGNPNKASYQAYKNNFRMIDHVEMFTGRWVPDPNRNNELHPQTIGVGMLAPVVKHNFLDRVSNELVITGCSVEYIQMFARIPLETAFTEYDSGLTTNNVIYSSYYKPSLYFVGNGQPFKIDIYGRNYAVWEIGNINPQSGLKIAAANRIRSGYVPSNSSHKNINALSQAGFKRVAYYFYTAGLAYLGTTPVPDAKYSILTFKKTDNSDITSTDLATFNEITAIQKAGRDTGIGGIYPLGFHSYAYLDTVVPTGAYLDRINGRYAHTSDGITWTTLPQSDQDKLNGLRIGDGENNIYVPHGQSVKLMKQEW